MSTLEAVRRRLPDVRQSVTHRFVIEGQYKCYLIVGLYEDGTPGELFVNIAKEGSTFSGLVDAFAIQVSMSLQYGVPLQKIVEKHLGTSYEPAGMTSNPEIPHASSITDYIARWMKAKFLSEEVKNEVTADEAPEEQEKPFLGTDLGRWDKKTGAAE